MENAANCSPDDGKYHLDDPVACVSVRNEVIGFFRANPFLLVSEGRLASLLCRPPEIIHRVVRALEEAGYVTRRFGEALLGVEEVLAGNECHEVS